MKQQKIVFKGVNQRKKHTPIFPTQYNDNPVEYVRLYDDVNRLAKGGTLIRGRYV